MTAMFRGYLVDDGPVSGLCDHHDFPQTRVLPLVNGPVRRGTVIVDEAMRVVRLRIEVSSNLEAKCA